MKALSQKSNEGDVEKALEQMEPDFDLVTKFYSMLSGFEEYGLDKDDKSVNAHNCRKFAMLTKMFICHKFITLLNFDSAKSEIEAVFTKYSKAYLELISVVPDLQMYVLHLDQSQRGKILEEMKAHV